MPDERIDPHYDWTETAGTMHAYMAGPRRPGIRTSMGPAGFFGIAGTTVVGLEQVESSTLTSTRIAFVRWIADRAYVMVMNADGSNATRLTDGEDPAWSPDGRSIAFVRRSHLHTMNGEGGAIVQLSTNGEWPGSGDARPAWSPDGDQITFDRQAIVQTHDWASIGGAQLYLATSDGSHRARLTSIRFQARDPSWSPSGDRIACARYDGHGVRDAEDTWWPLSQIVVVDLDGNVVATPGASGAIQVKPAWSPDGTKLAFCQRIHDFFHVHTMDADGANVMRLTEGFTNNLHPAWSPDGRRIAFHRQAGGDTQVFTMNADGSDQRQITRGLAPSHSPTWTAGHVPRRHVLIGAGDATLRGRGSAMFIGHVHGAMQSVIIMDTPENGRAEMRIATVKSGLVSRACQVVVVHAPAGVTDIRYLSAPLKDEHSKQNGIELELGSKPTAVLVVLSSTTARIQAVAAIADDRDALLPAVSAAAEHDSIVCRGGFARAFDAAGTPLSGAGISALRFDARNGALLGAG